MLFALFPLLQLLNTSWWLENTGVFYGIPGEDINYTTIGNLTGSGITICAMADGARFDHSVYAGRAVDGQFLDGFENVEELVPQNPEANFVGQKALGLAAGYHDNVCQFDGTAPGANVMSIDFYNASGRQESLQYIVCHHSDVWDISLLLYKEWFCEERRCKYISSDNIMRAMAGECLYDAKGGDVRKFITPAGNDDKLTDVFFTPPTRWPLMFVVSAVSNRGVPINRGSEGAGIFISCPGTRMDQDTPPGVINYALPDSNMSCNPHMKDPTSFEYANASASIFAGAMAVVMEVKKDMTLADLRYLFAMTATVVNPYSKLWNRNSWSDRGGLLFNRRCGFGRVNLGQAVELAKKWKKNNYSVGDFLMTKVTNSSLLHLSVYPDEDPRSGATFTFTSETTQSEIAYCLVMNVEINAKVLGFGSLIVHLISPGGTRCELKFLTEESALNSDVEKLELPSSEFLGEPLHGEWRVEFPKRDGGDRGLITGITLEAFYTKERPDMSEIAQINGSDPYQPLNEDIVEFKNKTLTMIARTEISWQLNWKNDPYNKHKKCEYNTWLQREGQRVKLKTKVDSENTTYTLSYVPSVFKNGTEMNLTMESLVGDCGGWSATVPVIYVNDMEEEDNKRLLITKYKDYDNTYPMKDGKFVIPMKDWTSGGFSLKWSLNMSELLDDGYSCSACITMITIDTGRIARRTFERNLGEADFDIKENGAVPTNDEYIIELGPSSARRENFERRQVRVVIERDGTNKKPYQNPFKLPLNIGILVVLSANFLFVGTRIYCLNRRRQVDDDRPLETDVNVDEVQ